MPPVLTADSHPDARLRQLWLPAQEMTSAAATVKRKEELAKPFDSTMTRCGVL